MIFRLRTAALAAVLGSGLLQLPAARPAAAVNICQPGTCVACAPAIPGVVGNLIPDTQFTDATADEPIAFVDPRDNSKRRLVATQEGAILVWDGATSTILPTPFLDLRNDGGLPGLDLVSYGGERGLLALTVAPDYATSGHFFVYYTSRARAALGITTGTIVVERYTRSAADPNLADPASGLVILGIEHPATNHNGGWLAFGPDDMLYITTGDGGGGCDSQGPNGQNVNALLGKMLRIDVLSAPAAPDCGNDDISTTNYAIPATNPLVGEAGCDEIWNYGLRNPFRFSFDRTTGDIWIGDVGQDNWEEFDFQSATLPAHEEPMNFGWVVREGCDSSNVAPSACNGCTPGVNCPAANNSCQYPAAGDYWDPVFCHSNPSPSGWSSGLGGYRYRGNFVPSLAGRYLYSDVGRGDIWVSTAFDPSDLASATSCCWDGGNSGIYAFAEDHLGEIYVVNGGAGRVDCIHNGAGCFWATWGGLFEDGFETNDTSRWSSTVP